MAEKNTPASADPSTPPAQLVTLDIGQLTELIAGAVARAGANADLANSIATGIANSQRRKKTIGEYLATTGNYYHPDPKTAIKFRPNAKFYQNGADFQWDNIFDQEVDLLNRLTHSGRYIKRLVEVSFREEAGGEHLVHINYNNKAAGLNAIKENVFRRPEDKTWMATILRSIVAEQEMEDRETAELLQEKEHRRVRLAEARA